MIKAVAFLGNKNRSSQCVMVIQENKIRSILKAGYCGWETKKTWEMSDETSSKVE